MQVYGCWMHTTSPVAGAQLQETLGRVFGQFAKMIARRQATDPQAMSRTDYSILGILENSPHEAGIRISGMAAAMGHDLSTISRRVSHLEGHRLIERLPDPSDGRACTVRLTATGTTALHEERTSRTGLLSRILVDWPEADLVDLDRLLTRLSDDLAADADASALPSNSFQTTARTSS